LKKNNIKIIVTIIALTVLCATSVFSGCGSSGGSAESISGTYVIVESDSSDHPTGSSVSFKDGVATNMWPVGKRDQSQYSTMEAQDGFTAMIFEPFAGIENFTYYLKKDGGRIEVWSAISYSLRDNDDAPGSYSFIIEKQ
jgi:hypothetical protein